MPHPLPIRYLALLAFVTLQRVLELAHSRRNIARLRAARPLAAPATGARDRAAAAGDARDWAAMVGVHTLLIVLPALEVGILGRSPPPALWIPAFALFVLAQGLRYWSITSLGRAWNARAVVDPSAGVVSRGPYRWIRHPNYLAMLIEFTTVPLAGGAWISWLVLNALHTPVLVRRIRAEEALLSQIPGYAAAMQGKNRFVPGQQRRMAAP